MSKAIFCLTILLVSFAYLPTSVSALDFNKNLSVGSRSEEVGVLQRFLISNGFLSGTATNYFGEQTKAAVQAFQRKNNISPTGGWYELTRQKANLAVSKAPSLSLSLNATTTNKAVTPPPAVTSSKKDVELTIVTQAGFVSYADNATACNRFETCKKAFPAGTKILLKAFPLEGYAFSGWSEAACGTNKECTIPLVSDTTVYASFKVISLKRVGKIIYPTASDTCEIGIGHQTCDLPIYWINDTGLDMSLRINGKEYVINPEDQSSPAAKSPVNPESLLAQEPKDALGPTFFPLTPGIQTIELRSGGQSLDTVKMEVKCKSGLYYQYSRICWQDGAKKLTIFRQEGVLIKSDVPGIACAYKLESCFAGFPSGTKVTLTATTAPGYSFNGWTGDCSGKAPTCTLVMDKDKTVGTAK